MKTQDERTQTMSFDKNLGGEGVTRRGFVGGMGAMMAATAAMAAGVSTAHADEAEEAADAEAEEAEAAEEAATEEEAAEESAAEEESATENVPGSYLNYPTIESTTGWTGTPDDVLALGVSTMPLDDLNQYREAYIERQTDYTMEDGTVVPAVFAKVRALIHTYGIGCGNTANDSSYSRILEVFDEDQAQAFLDMPMGVEFTAYEFAAKTGRDLEECEEVCEYLASEGFLVAIDVNRGRVFRQAPYFQGVAEYNTIQIITRGGDVNTDTGVFGYDMMLGTDSDVANTGTPVFYYVPVDASVTSDGTILPFDDLKEKIKTKNLVAICPCPCRYGALANTYGYENIPSYEDFATGEYEDYFSDLCDQRVETCIMTGDEAAYWIERGMGREITGEQAAEYLQRSVDDGFMLETTFGKNTDTICSCHVDSCNILGMWNSIGEAEDIAACDAFKQVSHYTLQVDSDLCIACGTCVDRCPLHCITINDDGWAEAGVNCFRCGQCAYVCPQNARHLVQRDESELAPLPQGMLDDANVKAAYRFEKGLITFPEEA